MLVFTAGIAQAQKTQEYDQPDYYYNYGLELYQKELYGPAITQFANYMRVANNKLYKTNAAIYPRTI